MPFCQFVLSRKKNLNSTWISFWWPQMLFFHLFVLPSGPLRFFLFSSCSLSLSLWSQSIVQVLGQIPFAVPASLPSQSQAADWWVPHFPKQPRVHDWQHVHSQKFKWEEGNNFWLSLAHTHTITHILTHSLVVPEGRNMTGLRFYWTSNDQLSVCHSDYKYMSTHLF